MEYTMKFIHCSDIHLDSPMESNLTPRQARERNAELCATFARMVDYAKAEGVTADTSSISSQTVLEESYPPFCAR